MTVLIVLKECLIVTRQSLYNRQTFTNFLSGQCARFSGVALSELPPPSDQCVKDLRAQRIAAMRDGCRAVSPGLLALTVWGVVTGVAMVKSGLAEHTAVVMSLLVYAGSAQLTSLPLIMAGAPLWLIFAAGTVVNLRFIIFGAALHPYFKNMRWPKRLLMGYLSVDVAFVVFMPRFSDAPQKGTLEQHWFYLGALVSSWTVWQVTSIAGIALGSFVPSTWSLDFAAILALIAMMMPLVSNKPILVAILAAGVVAWITQMWPLRLGLIAAVIAGSAAGMWAEKVFRKGRV